jgi:DNA (cytosine-5)-methyltransferase 1
MENVVQVAKSEAWAEARAILTRAGYGLSESRITASFYGVPQNRRRFFVIGRLGERDAFLQSCVAGAASKQPMTIRQFFNAEASDVAAVLARPEDCLVWSPEGSTPTGHELPITPRPNLADAALLENGFVYCRPLRNGRGVRTIDEPLATITRTSWERPRPGYLNAPHPDDPVPALATAVLNVDQISRLQGFPANWRWIAKAKQDRFQMIANAVPGPVARALGEVILARHQGRTVPAIEGRFLDWLERSGRSRTTARNIKANVNRARRILAGRTFADVAMEIATLEATPGFTKLSRVTRSDLRQALRLHAQFLVPKARTRPKRDAKCAPIASSGDDQDVAKAA